MSGADRSQRTAAEFMGHFHGLLNNMRLTLQEGQDNRGLFPFKLRQAETAQALEMIEALDAYLKTCTPVSNAPRLLSLVRVR